MEILNRSYSMYWCACAGVDENYVLQQVIHMRTLYWHIFASIERTFNTIISLLHERYNFGQNNTCHTDCAN